MWPGFDSRTQRYMLVEFVIGSRPCSEGFSPGSPVFRPLHKSTLLNSISIWKQWTKSQSLEMPRQIPIYNYFISLHLSEEGEFSYILSSQSELDPASFIDVSLIQAVEQEESSSPFKRMMLYVRF